MAVVKCVQDHFEVQCYDTTRKGPVITITLVTADLVCARSLSPAEARRLAQELNDAAAEVED